MTKKLKFYKGDMLECEIYKLVDFYDPILKEPTVPFKLETHDDFERARYVAFSLAETLSEHEGLGLSANQVGMNERVCAINMGAEIWTLFNPVITSRSLTPSTYQEGCLSYPGLYLTVKRSERITVKFQAVGGQWVEQEFTGLTAVVIQHELDHLDGVLFTDKVSSIKLEQAKRKVKKNIKKMQIYLRERKVQKAQEEQQMVISEKQKLKPIASDVVPSIQILEPIQTQTQKPAEVDPGKFVYKVETA